MVPAKRWWGQSTNGFSCSSPPLVFSQCCRRPPPPPPPSVLTKRLRLAVRKRPAWQWLATAWTEVSARMALACARTDGREVFVSSVAEKSGRERVRDECSWPRNVNLLRLLLSRYIYHSSSADWPRRRAWSTTVLATTRLASSAAGWSMHGDIMWSEGVCTTTTITAITWPSIRWNNRWSGYTWRSSQQSAAGIICTSTMETVSSHHCWPCSGECGGEA